jgi:hypothetical protein
MNKASSKTWIYSIIKKIKNKIESFLGALVATQTTRKKCLGEYNFFSEDLVNKKLYPCRANTFLHLQKLFQKITIKFGIMGTYPNFQLSPLGTLVL